MGYLGELIVKIGADISEFDKGVENAMKSADDFAGGIRKMGDSMVNIGQKGTMLVTAPIAAGFTAATLAGADFESQLVKLRLHSDATTEQLATMAQTSKDLGEKYGYTAAEMAMGMDILATKGLRAEDIIMAMPTVVQTAAAAQIDLAEASDIVYSSIVQFGLGMENAGHVSDVLVKGADISSASVQDLGLAMSYAGSLAKMAGWSFEETTAAMGLLSDAGLQAQKMGTGLRGMFSTLLDEKKVDQLKELGYTVQDNNGKLLSASAIFQQFADRGMSAAEITEIFGVEAAPAVAALIAQVDKLGERTDTLATVQGVAQQVADTNMDTFNGQMARAASAISTLAITIAESGILENATRIIEGITDWVKTGIDFIKNLNQTNPQLVQLGITLAIAAAAFFPAVMAAGYFIGALTTVGGAVAGVTTALSGMTAGVGMAGAAMAILLNPITLAVAGIIALVAAFAYLYRTNENVRNSVNKLIGALSGKFQQLAQTIQPLVNTMVTSIMRVVDSVKNLISTAVDFLGQLFVTLQPYIQGALGGILDALTYTLPPIITLFTQAFTAISAMLGEVAKTFEAWAPYIIGFIKLVADVMCTIWTLVAPVVVPLVTGVFETIVGVITVAVDLITGIFNTLMHLLRGDFSGAWESLTATISKVWDGVKSIVGNAIQALTDTLWGLIDTLTGGWAGKIVDAISGPFVSAYNKIVEYVNKAIDAWNSLPAVPDVGKIQPMAPPSNPTPAKNTGRPIGGRVSMFASGGIVTAPTLGWIGEKKPEAVLPLDRLPELLGLDGAKTLNVYVEIDGRQVVKAIGQPLVDELRLKTGMRV